MLETLSRYATPTLTLEDRFRLFRMLGLAEVDFTFVELKGARVLRVKQLGKLPWRTLLGEPSPLLPRAELRHPEGEWLGGTPATSLWSEIFPSPLHALERLKLSPPEFRDSWARLRKGITALESRMRECEVGCLAVWSPHESDPMVLFGHFVRQRCQRVGTSSALVKLAHSAIKRELAPESLREWFGTQATFFSLDLRARGPGLDCLSLAIEELLADRASRVEFRLSSHSFPEMGL